MARLFIRNRKCGYITFIHNKQELLDFIDSYLPGRRLVIGDIATFNSGMRQALLKLVEENPALDCYSSEDLVDPIIQSRFVEIIKDPIILDLHHNVDEFMASDRKYQASHMFLNGLTNSGKLRAPGCNKQTLKLLLRNG